jgi:hypothetical protein
MINPANTFVLGYGRDWYFQPAGNYSPVVVFPIISSDAGSPIILTTGVNHTIQTNDNVVVYLHNGNNGIIGTKRGNFPATRIDSTHLSLQGSVGVNPGTGGFVAKCNDGTGVTGLTCVIKDSHTEGATVRITKAGNWVASSQGIFLFYFSFSKDDIKDLNAGQKYARQVFYTDASGNPQYLDGLDDVSVISL